MANLLCLNNVATVLYVVIPVVVCNLRGETSFGNMHIRLGATDYTGFGLLILQVFRNYTFLFCCQFFY